MKTYIVGITGASGVVIGIRLIEELVKLKFRVLAIISNNASNVMDHELGANFQLPANARYFQENDKSAPMNSSSFQVEGMVISPCSMKTLAAIAHGYAHNLIVRAAENQLRTNSPLVLVPRETPLTLSNLENMMKLKQAGAILCPPMAAYYHHPQTIADMTDFFVGKILDVLSIPNQLYRRWGTE